MASSREPDRGTTPPVATSAAEPTSSTASDLVNELLQARPSEPLALLFDEARIASALFGTEITVGLGRFRVLERLGSGSMGVVYAAHDPELNRGVALKIVRSSARSRDAMLPEAQALARLSHPNVVPVYDVGADVGCIYIVMELVRGETLRRWVIGRGRREILDAYRQAGLALAAAHAAGLVHRDFKPDNAIVGSDGRVRVVDFGLACEATDPSHAGGHPQSIAGTPRYMAPEQAAGLPVTPAADQYSFCVALREALTARGTDRSPPVPRWIAAALARGSAADPAMRFATMPDLLAALARDPAQRWWRRAVVGALTGTLAVAALLGWSARGDRCAGGEAALAAAWAPAAQQRMLARIAELSPYGRTLAPRLEAALRTHATRWVAGHRDACLAHERGEQSDELLDRRMACLAGGLARRAAFADAAGQADAAGLPDVARSVYSIGDPASCSDIARLLADAAVPPPALRARISQLRERLQQAEVAIEAGRAAEARAAAAAGVTQARALGYLPVLAEALLVDGRALLRQDRVASIPVLREATSAAAAAGMDSLAVEAWARRAWAQGTESDPESALDGLDLVEALAARPSTERFARALLYNNLGGVELAREHRDRARAAFQRALAESRGVVGPGALELLVVTSNLALVTDDRAAADRLFAATIAELGRLLGPDHPDTLLAAFTRGTTTIVATAPAAALLTDVCERYVQHGPTFNAAWCWTELGYLRDELGQRTLAIAAMQRAVDLDPGDPTAAIARPYLRLWRGDAAGAAHELRDALAAPEAPDAPWWERLDRAERELALGRARQALGDQPGAQQVLAASVARLEAIVRNHPAAVIRRKLGRAQAELARTLASLGATRAQRAPVARAAAAWLREAEAEPAEIDAIDAIAESR